MEPSGVAREGRRCGRGQFSNKKVLRLQGEDSKIPRESKMKKKVTECSERWKQMNIVFDVLPLCCSLVYKNQ
jgi:hypothetical protein